MRWRGETFPAAKIIWNPVPPLAPYPPDEARLPVYRGDIVRLYEEAFLLMAGPRGDDLRRRALKLIRGT